ncbi:MAG: MBL fold metallo-hydrolase [Anaerolineae bacterium]|nr:MBL fold metallo-hydrolase [Anaerolineae bacterium]
MRIGILGAESLGVRGLSCVVETADRLIVIDPGLALGYQRYGLLPHPVQVAVGEQVRRQIRGALEDATDIVVSHYHGDHVPLPDANPYQLRVADVATSFRRVRLWTKGPSGLSPNMIHRRAMLGGALNRELPNVEGESDGPLTFSPAVPHGEPGTHLGTVMMTRIEDAGTVFVHASDIQLLDAQAVSVILAWQPDIVVVGGPPLYLTALSSIQRKRAREEAERLAQGVDTLILDHHLLRCQEGLSWLGHLAAQSNHEVLCAADYMGRPRCLLEARRAELYRKMPVPEGWHAAYARGETDTQAYQHYCRRCL